MAKVLITGGTGLIGRNLTTALVAKGYEVIILSRTGKKTKDDNRSSVKYSKWNVDKQQIDNEVIKQADHIIHLAGAGVMDKRWTKKYKNEIISSRINSSELIFKSLVETNNKVKSVISASAIGWYGADKQTGHAFVESDEPDDGFLGETCRLWEESISSVERLGIRAVKLRFGIVLAADGGALKEFIKPLKFGIAIIIGFGKQVISWIHIDDLVRLIIFAMENALRGSYNAVAPVPVTNKTLSITLASQMKSHWYIPIHVPEFFLKIFLGERSIEVLKSATVSDEKIKKEGFVFLYPTIEAALKQITLK